MATIKNITVTKTGQAYNAVLDLVLEINFNKRPEAVINGCRVTMSENRLSVTDKDGLTQSYPIDLKKDYGYRAAVDKVADIVLPAPLITHL